MAAQFLSTGLLLVNSPKWQAALGQLLEASRYARDLERDIWDFAVRVESLLAAGLTQNDLRWLGAKGFIDQGIEIGSPGLERTRKFRRGQNLTLSPRSCLVFTNAGLAFAKEFCAKGTSERPVDSRPIRRSTRPPAAAPRWDAGTRTLWLGSVLVKEFKVPAKNQELVLAAFSEEGWPSSVDDPLPPTSEVNSKRRLHDTIIRLNRSHLRRLMRFHGNGNGLAVHWQYLSKARQVSTKATPDRR